MFRSFAVALIAASMFAAPVLAQDANPHATRSPAAQSGPTTAPGTTVKTDVSPLKHRKHIRVAHDLRMHKHVKYAHHAMHKTKYAHRILHGASRKAYAAVPAHHAATKSTTGSAIQSNAH
jgi:hypothetical protein